MSDLVRTPPICVGRGGVGLHPPHSVHQPGDGGQVPGLDPGPGDQSAIQQHYTHAHNNKVILEIWNLFILLLTVFICIQSNSSYRHNTSLISVESKDFQEFTFKSSHLLTAWTTVYYIICTKKQKKTGILVDMAINPQPTNFFPFWWVFEELWPCQQGSLSYLFHHVLCKSLIYIIQEACIVYCMYNTFWSQNVLF